ncbi:MAG: hypothetical protein NTW21_31470 [Verrucomicrobia bacterium]|nr:hypothetical protein [Verrucomicrobiota bacterium]
MPDDLLPDLLAAVDQQLGSPQTTYVAGTLARLIASGLDAPAAKVQIALCLGEELDQVLRHHRAFDQAAYRVALDALPFPAESEEE